MRKIYSILFTALFVLATNSYAQVSTYTFSQSTGTYTAITGGTVIHASGWDDAVASATIPFSFTINGIAYTSVSVNSNGYATFGSTVSGATSSTPISATTAFAAAISAFGRDIISNSSTIEYGTTGTAPNRKFVIQWNNARRYSLGAIIGDVLNFQIVLNETTNVIDIVYGTCTATSTTSYICQVGLRGAANTDFNNRSTATNWAATTAGASNTASCTSLNTIMPASGQTFTWTPPPPCSGTPLPGTPAVTTFYTCTGATQVLSVTGAPISPGITYQWESSADGSSGWANVSGGTGATTTTYTTAAYSGTPIYYRMRTTCSNGGGSDVTAVITVTNPAAPTTQASAFTLTAIGSTTATLSWTNGNGNNRTVYVNSTNSFTDPVSPASPGTANTAWANTGQQLVYDGTASSVSITGLTVGTTYYVRIYESQKCTAPASWYYNTATATGNPGNFITVAVPANDDCASARALTPQTYVVPGTCPNAVSGTTLGANTSSITAPPSAAFFSSQDDDVWYQFTATHTAHIVRLCNVTFPIGAATSMGVTLNPGCTSSDAEVTGNPAGSLITLTGGTGEMSFSGLTIGTLYKIRVLTNGTTSRANFDISVLEPPAMTYVSSTTTQSSTASLIQSAVNQQIIRLEVTVTGGSSPLNMTQINFTTNGTTAPADIANARVFYTGTSTTFATTTPFGITTASPNGAFSISGSQPLSGTVSGNITNYFWLVYDVSCTGTVANVLDAECTGFTLGAAQVPTVTAPTGTRAITASAAPARTDGNGTTAISTGTVNAPMVYVNAIGSTLCPSTVSQVNFTVAGTAPAADIANAKCYYTTTTTFSTATPFGVAIANPVAGAISFTGTQSLANGNNYFWLVYDIACSATAANTVNGDVTTIVINSIPVAAAGTAAVANAIAAITGYTTIANGEWNNPATWVCGNIPPNNNASVTIAHNITVSTTGNVAGNVTVNTGSSLSIQPGGNLTLGASSAGTANGNSNKLLSISGTLNITGGTLNVNGGINMVGSFTMNAGTLNLDPNDGTNAGSFANSNGGFYIAQGVNTVSVTGGNINFLDPMYTSAAGTGQSVIGYSNLSADLIFGTGCTVTFGGGDDQNAANVNGFYVESNLSTGTLEIGTAIIAGGRFAAQREVTSRQAATNYITKFKNLTINAGAELTLTAGSAPLSITGDLVNNGIITNAAAATGSGLFFADCQYSSAVVIFPLTTAQTISGTGFFKKATADADPTAQTGNIIGGMTVYHTRTSPGLTLSMPVTATAFVRLINGKVNTTPVNFLALGHGTALPGNAATLTASIGTVYGFSATAPTSIATYLPGGWVNGTFNRWVTATTTSGQQGILPVGSDTSRPALVAFTTAPTAAGYLSAQWNDNNGGNNGLPLSEPAVTPSSIAIVSPGYWQINRDATLAGGTYDATVTNTAAISILDYVNTTLIKRANSASPWAIEGTHVATTGSNAAPTARRNGLTSFSEFAIAGGTGAIPITVEYFRGNKLGSNHQLDWKVSCTNTQYAMLTIEYSTDGSNFANLYAIRETALRCLQPFSYTNTRPQPGINYYRLKMQDDNGVVRYSSIVALLNKEVGFEIVNITPNPVADGRFKLNITTVALQQMEVVVADMQGRVVVRKAIALTAGFNAVDMNVSNLGKGTYQVYGITGGEKTKTISFVKQ